MVIKMMISGVNSTNNNIYRKNKYPDKNQLGFGAGKIPDKLIINTISSFENMGQIQSNAIRSAGKAILSPIVILLNPFLDHKDEQSRRYSAALLPVEAVLSFMSTLASNFAVSTVMDNLANKGRLGDFYNPSKPSGGAHLKILKDRVLVVATLAAIPVVSYIVNKVYPTIIHKIVPGFLEKNGGSQE